MVMLGVHRNGAAIFRNRAADVLELHGGVVNVEAVGEHVVQAPQNDVARGGRNVVDQHMAAEGMGARTETPDVQIVDVQHAIDASHRRGDFLQSYAARKTFEQNIQRFADDVPSRPDD